MLMHPLVGLLDSEKAVTASPGWRLWLSD